MAVLRRSLGRHAGTRAKRSKSCNVKRGGAKASAKASTPFKASNLSAFASFYYFTLFHTKILVRNIEFDSFYLILKILL